MSLFSKIKAFFTFKGEQKQVELERAEVKENGIFLHPIEDPNHTFFVKTSSVSILITPKGEIFEEDITVIDKPKREPRVTPSILENDGDADKNHPTDSYVHPLPLSHYTSVKKRFSVLLYQDEYDMLMHTIHEKGYKKSEYFLACMTSAKKQSMEAAYKRYTNEHKARRKIDLTEAKKAQAEAANAQKVATGPIVL